MQNRHYHRTIVPSTIRRGREIAKVRIKENPYANVDFETMNQYKSSFHSHVRTSHNQPIEIYQWMVDYGFDIYSRTEKDRIIAPVWEPSPDFLDVLGFEREGGATEHSIVLFAEEVGDYAEKESTGAIQIRAHPHDPGRNKYEISEMVQQFNQYQSLIGLEVISRNFSGVLTSDEYIHPHRRGEGQYYRSGKIWDTLLKECNRNIYGTGTTDAYNDMTPTYGNTLYNCGWTLVIADELKENKIKDSMMHGRMFFVSHMEQDKEPPKVVGVSTEGDAISVDVEGEYAEIYWFYGDEVVGFGDTYDLRECKESQKYVRFEVWTKESTYWPNKVIFDDPGESSFYEANIVGSQPFLLEPKT